MSVEEVAAALGMRTSSVRRAIATGRIKAQRIGRRFLAVTPEEVERYRKAPRHPGGRPRKDRPDA